MKFLTLLLGAATVLQLMAAEGGNSHYMPGTMGDFAMAMMGPKGFYIRNDLAYLRGDIGSVTLGNRVYTSAKQRVWVDMIKAVYLSDAKILGGRFGTVLTLPVVLNAHVTGTVAFPDLGQKSGSRTGLSDVTATGFLSWNSGKSYFQTGANLYMPVGGYDPNNIINFGRNYWSTVPTATYTWLDPKRGHEISATTGVLFNSKNNATNYQTGIEWYSDFMLSQHFSAKFAIGLEGYVLHQLSDDSGALLDRANKVLPALGLQPLGGFRGESFGIGPAVVLSQKIGGKDVSFIFKWMPDLVHNNRFNNTYTMLSIAFKL